MFEPEPPSVFPVLVPEMFEVGSVAEVFEGGTPNLGSTSFALYGLPPAPTPEIPEDVLAEPRPPPVRDWSTFGSTVFPRSVVWGPNVVGAAPVVVVLPALLR
jgi:hypothetical protein